MLPGRAQAKRCGIAPWCLLEQGYRDGLSSGVDETHLTGDESGNKEATVDHKL